MAVALDAKSTSLVNDTAGGTSYVGTINITVGTGLTNGFLLVLALWDHAATSTTAHWDSAGSNQLMASAGAGTNSAGALRVEMFGLVNPTAGNKTLNLTWAGTGNELQIFAISFSGVNQTTPTANVTTLINSSQAANATATLTVSAGTNDAVVAAFVNDFSFAASPTNQTALWALNGITEGGCGNYVLPAAASNSMTAKNGSTSDNLAAIGVDIVAALGGATFLAAPNIPILQAVKRAAYW